MSGRVRLVKRVTSHIGTPVADLPAFLCPGIARASFGELPRYRQRIEQPYQQWRLLSTTVPEAPRSLDTLSIIGLKALPQQCAGCGAMSQTVDKAGAGHYTLTRKSTMRYFESLSGTPSQNISEEDELVTAALANAGSFGKKLHLKTSPAASKLEPPLCDRCHQLQHHEIGASIHHPSAKSLQATVFESPYKYNHVYHVIDAADFPMSVIPGLHKLLHLTPQRAKNRRAKTGKFYAGRKTDVSFLITRSDLLAPVKDQVDSLMPYLRATLRDVLGRSSKNVRLGNIRCVSAKKAWWTKELKEEIWGRGGGGWMVGKVNVGKSQLIHNIFPKGRGERNKMKGKKMDFSAASTLADITKVEAAKKLLSESVVLEESRTQDEELEAKSIEALALEQEIDEEDAALESDTMDSTSLLPPAQPEVDYPVMPLVSALPGTTASPIRLPFGNGKGELIDLPGLSRGDLEHHVLAEHRPSLVMRSRVSPEQQVIKPGQSLLLGGFIRITPTSPDVMMLSYAFTPIEAHLTSTEKAIGTQMKTRESSLLNMSIPGTEEKIASAGTFYLKWDVTRQRAGPVTRKDAGAVNPEKLPYRIFATDILIEGCGWIELVAQVSKRRFEAAELTQETDDWGSSVRDDEMKIKLGWPKVEVFSPEGRFVGERRPMNAWLFVATKPGQHKLRGRPRKSMKGIKKLEKTRKKALL